MSHTSFTEGLLKRPYPQGPFDIDKKEIKKNRIQKVARKGHEEDKAICRDSAYEQMNTNISELVLMTGGLQQRNDRTIFNI